MSFKFNTAGTCAIALLALSLVSCSTFKKVTGSDEESGAEIQASGPTVLNPRISPETIELTGELQPRQTPEVLAEVKDFSGKVNDVRLRFVDVPIEVKMKKVGESTWRASLSNELVKKLAVGDQTTTYEANIYARDDKGKVAVSKEPLKVAVKAPSFGKRAG
ncbi:MAG: hypothetical protein NDJ90_12895 [Oligoflexia bacterium]|nr:hypothetical protein [Oligoflexia bacterium]